MGILTCFASRRWQGLRWFTRLAVPLFIVATGLVVPPAPAFAQTGEIRGTVTHKVTGAPLPDITVWARTEDGTDNAMATTDANGAYLLWGLPSRFYYISAGKTIFEFIPEAYQCPYPCAANVSTPVPVSPGGVTSGINFSLAPPGSISGTVTRATDGVPIAFGWVRLDTLDGNYMTSFTTDAAGVFTASTVPAGTYTITTDNIAGYVDERYGGVPCDPSCAPGSGTPVIITAGASAGPFNIALAADPPTGAISGVVRHGLTSGPIQSVLVGVLDSFNQSVAGGTTDAQGAYTLPVAPGTYTVRTWASPPFSNFQNEVFSEIACSPTCPTSGGTPVVVNSGVTTTGINFTLAPGASITGTVVGGTPAVPLNSVPVNVVSLSGTMIATAVTNASGAYAVPVLPGTYLVETAIGANGLYADERYNGDSCVSACAPGTGTTVAAISGTTTSGINFSLDPTWQLTGVVTNALTAAPLSSVTIQVYSATGQLLRTAMTNGGGTYSLRMPVGSYFVRTLVAPGSTYRNELYNDLPCAGACAVTTGTPVAVSAGATTVANFGLMPGGVITGTVTRSDTTATLEGINIRAYDAAGTVVGETWSYDAGQYTLSLPTGTFKVRALTPLGFGTNLTGELYNDIPCPFDCPMNPGTTLTVTPGATVSGINFALGAGGTITGRVTDAGGVAKPGVNIYAHAPDGSVVKGLATDIWGYFALAMPPGSYYLRTDTPNATNLIDEVYNDRVCVPGCDVIGSQPVAVAANQTTSGIDFALTSGGMLSGRVVDATTGAPVPDITVEISTASGEPVATVLSYGGRYSFASLPTGSYRVRTLNAGTKGYANALYAGLPCGGCAVSTGTPVQVTAGAATANVDIELGPGGAMSGVATNEGGATMRELTFRIYNQAGAFVATGYPAAADVFTVDGLPAGTYFARTSSSTFINEWYGGVPCVGACETPMGTPILVTVGTTTTNVNFQLTPGASISGIVTDGGTGQAIVGDGTSVRVELFTADGLKHAGTAVDPAGGYQFDGLAAGSYYLRTSSTGGYIDEQFNNLVCLKSCTPAAGTPIVVPAGGSATNVTFALSAGGRISGAVIDASSSAPIAGATVRIYAADGTWVGDDETDLSGAYVIDQGLPSGTYYARSFSSSGYLDQIYNGLAACLPECVPTSGTPIVVTAGATTTDVNFALVTGTELILNGSFNYGTAQWMAYATPSMDYMSWRVSSGMFEFDRLRPPLGTANQAVVFQNTGAPVANGATLLAQFDLGNTSTERKRLSVLVHDADFGDLSVCTFWLPPHLPPTRYALRTRTTRAWTNATISFYGASANIPAGYYQVDNVSLQAPSSGPIARTDCVEPSVPAGSGGAAGADLLINGTFDSGAVTPGWSTFGQINSQVDGGVFEFVRPAGTPAGVLLQPTGQSLPVRTQITSTFQLGNSSAVRKRVTVILHDNDFSDLSACTFWLPPGQALSTYTYRTFTTKVWTNATLSIYPATVDLEPWLRFDNATLRTTPGGPTAGTECVEPASAGDALADSESKIVTVTPAGDAAALTSAPTTRTGTSAADAPATGQPAPSPASGDVAAPWLSHWVADGFLPVGDWLAGPSWLATAEDSRLRTLQPVDRLDLSHAASAVVRFTSTLRAPSGSVGLVQVSRDGTTWESVAAVDAASPAADVHVDLAGYRGDVIYLRFAFEGRAPDGDASPDAWRLDAIGLDIVLDLEARRR